jgi:hypothetical protein
MGDISEEWPTHSSPPKKYTKKKYLCERELKRGRCKVVFVLGIFMGWLVYGRSRRRRLRRRRRRRNTVSM